MLLILLLLAVSVFGQSTYIQTNGMQVVGTLQIPTGSISPAGTGAVAAGCNTGQIYLQQATPVFPVGNLWRCLGNKWVSEFQPAPLSVHRTVVEDGGKLNDEQFPRLTKPYLAIGVLGVYLFGVFFGVFIFLNKRKR